MMPLHPTWEDIFLRLLLTVIAGAMLGFDREARGHAAGLRTTILVALAASVAMIQTNILLPLDGKDQGSFAVMDMMRLPLGILTGVGFLGGGAILKRGGSISGVTTAATLWIATVIGLCFGGGQLGLGVVATGLAILTLWGMQKIASHIPREHKGTLVVAKVSGSPYPDLDSLLRPAGYSAHFRKQTRTENSPQHEEIEIHFEIRWNQAEAATPSLDFLTTVNQICTVKSFELESETNH
jgi:putative Mg2+ transporter-C (MgtC) family protein